MKTGFFCHKVSPNEACHQYAHRAESRQCKKQNWPCFTLSREGKWEKKNNLIVENLHYICKKI